MNKKHANVMSNAWIFFYYQIKLSHTLFIHQHKTRNSFIIQPRARCWRANWIDQQKRGRNCQQSHKIKIAFIDFFSTDRWTPQNTHKRHANVKLSVVVVSCLTFLHPRSFFLVFLHASYRLRTFHFYFIFILSKKNSLSLFRTKHFFNSISILQNFIRYLMKKFLQCTHANIYFILYLHPSRHHHDNM